MPKACGRIGQDWLGWKRGGFDFASVLIEVIDNEVRVAKM